MEELAQHIGAGLLIAILAAWVSMRLTRRKTPSSRAGIVAISILAFAYATSFSEGPGRILTYLLVGAGVYLFVFLKWLRPAMADE